MTTRILIVEPDEAFAALLKQGLQADREYRVVAVSDGPSALAALQSNVFDLVIVDVGMTAPEPRLMLRAIRSIRAELPIMIIPIDGDIVPQELVPFDIRGILTKPFVLPDLPVRVAEALGRPLPVRTPMPVTSAPVSKGRPRALSRITLTIDDPRVMDALRALAESLNAEAVLLTDGNALAAQVGPLGRSGAETLAGRILQSRSATAQSSWITAGNEQVRFGQSISDSGEHLLYSIDVAEGIVLTVAVLPDASLRIIRAQARQTAETLLALGK
ncbi:MAG: response regulator [Anaerolineae bacterium]